MPRILFILIAAIFQAILAVSSSAWADGKRVALVIGNAAYSPEIGVLANPIPDAQAVSQAFVDAGFDSVRHVDNLTADAMRKELRDFSALASEADVAILYYAGHGIEVAEQNYLIPLDAKLTRSTDVEFEAISLASARAAVGGAKKLRMVVLDACRTNPYKISGTAGRSASSRGLGSIEPSAGEVVAYSAKEGTVAQDGPQGENSPFAAALVKSLSEPGLEIRLLFGRVRDDVLISTKNEQEPYTYASLGGEAIYLRPPVDQPSVTSAADEWKLVSASSSIEAISAFMSKYENDPVFKPLAQERLALLERGESSTPKSFKDCPTCPDLVVVPAGSFIMGSPDDEPNRDNDEGPQHRVTIAKPLAVGKYEVTVAQFREFVEDAKYKVGPACSIKTGEKYYDTPGRNVFNTGLKQDETHPAACLSWRDAKAYVYWLSRRTGFTYRLLTESEWEYAARAGIEAPYITGRILDVSMANINSNGTVPVGQYAANGFGLYDVQGNVWEWTEDCHANSYDSTPQDGSAYYVAGCERTNRGGAWAFTAKDVRFATRGLNAADKRMNIFGMRVAREIAQ